MEARKGGDGLPAPFTTAPVPVREVAHRKKNRQDRDISQYAIGMDTIASGNGNGNGNGNAGIIARTEITLSSGSTPVFIS
ncbi:hypothetical protein [Enterobacter cancerogenus]|uniref:hypothetical protein n=1 Tax=Enterobacter cancerogenus TaxID=69218 RepID=UPI000AE49835|nr:hypothetical protein [Enterobacter cancerogenus]